ncbi:WD repeat-containing protein 44-like [Zingiber officinale]|uniref:WD repeat-containing protein 44-like n=1 Tax=Zingiber officinale TaxID=94328 RepID=UPI001C4D43F2|nr:WD repeat-containing protein 44-like [Zingiber officinale]
MPSHLRIILAVGLSLPARSDRHRAKQEGRELARGVLAPSHGARPPWTSAPLSYCFAFLSSLSLSHSLALPSTSMAMASPVKPESHSPIEAEEKEEAAKHETGEEGEEGEDDDEEDDECFFESFDRVPSKVSFCVDLPSDSDDDEFDDVRMSFSSAVCPTGDLRCATFSREEFLAENRDDHDVGGDRKKPAGGGFDYDVWMDEQMPIKERRRRLLQGIGLASNKNLAAATLRLRGSMRGSMRGSIRKPAVDAPAAPLPPLPQSPQEATPPAPSPAPCSATEQPALTRCRSDTALAAVEPRPTLFRTASAPAALCILRDTTEGEDGGGGTVADENKNMDDGKEIADVSKDEAKGRLNLPVSMEEFERFFGHSPIVKELMRRVKLGGGEKNSNKAVAGGNKPPKSGKGKKGGGWLKNIKFVASTVGLISEKEKCGTASTKSASSATSATLATSTGENPSSSELMKVGKYGKSNKELTGLYMSQEIQAHQGSIWTIKFSWDGHYLASAGEDTVVQVWQVQECDIFSSPLRRQESRNQRSSPALGRPPSTKKTKRTKSAKRTLPDYIVLPEVIFSLSDKPFCSFEGHKEDVLDLCWSKSQHLLSSSMDKSVRLWDIETKTCLKLFAHNDYVTCIQFNPVDDGYFISGSLDAKVRVWSVPERQVVDWTDLHEMVTAACYTPDGQGALIGSHKGNCKIYKITDRKLSQEGQIEIKNKKKKKQAPKITGFQFAPDNPSEAMITSADSQVRVFEDQKRIHKFRGFRNTSSQISAWYTVDGRYVVCASEDSHVYVWKREAAAAAAKGKSTTRSHEHFFCKDVSVAVPWPSAGSTCAPLSQMPSADEQPPLAATDSQRLTASSLDQDPFPSGRSSSSVPPIPKKSHSEQELSSLDEAGPGGAGGSLSPSAVDGGSTSAPEDSSVSTHLSESVAASSAPSKAKGSAGGEQTNAWGLVVVTAGLGGEIRVFQNFGLPVRIK